MYESFFGLTALPFKITPDPAFIYWNKQHRRAASILAFGIEQLVPITVVTGDVGAGKTTLLQQFLEDAPADMTVGLISNYWSGMGGLYQWILNAFDLQASGNEVELFRVFQDFVVQEYAEGRRCVLIVDEAQNVADADLEQLRMLTNINAGKDSLLMLFLVGQPQLRDRLRQPNNNQIAQRVGASFHLKAMSAEDTCNYVRHRLKVAGAEDEIFDDAALKRIHEVSGGVPRLVNVVCELALVAAFGDEVRHIDGAYLDAFLKEAAESGMMDHLPVTLGLQDDESPVRPDASQPSPPLAIPRSGQGAQWIRLVDDPVAEPAERKLDRPSPAARFADPAAPATQPTASEDASIMENLMAPSLARRTAAQQEPEAASAPPEVAAMTDEPLVDDATDEQNDEAADQYRPDESELVDLPEIFEKVAEPKAHEPAPDVAPVDQDAAVSGPKDTDEDPVIPADAETPAASLTARDVIFATVDHGLDAVLVLLLAGAVYSGGVMALRDASRAPQAGQGGAEMPEAAPDPGGAEAPGNPGIAPDKIRFDPPVPLDDPDGAALLDRALNGGDSAPLEYARAALRGEPRAAYYLGQLYETGDGVPRDLALARAWYGLAGPDVRSARRRLTELGAPEPGSLAAPHPVLGGLLPDGSGEFIWTAGKGADAALYLLELAQTPDGPVRRLPPQSLSAVRVPDVGDARLWRVVSVDPETGRYAVSGWHLLSADTAAVYAGPVATPFDVAPFVTVVLPADITPAQKTLATEDLISAGFQVNTREGGAGAGSEPLIAHAYESDSEMAKRVARLLGAEAAIKLEPNPGPNGAPPLPGEILVTYPTK
ncbi:AAA family ATPase [Rhodobacteraceae bacterium F11138]|nr:AAA family ATPase [Rhodobacteraceae bacterium F11138]